MKYKLGFSAAGIFPFQDIKKMVMAAEEMGLESFWLSEDYFQAGAFSLAAACSVVTERIKIGIGVINPYTRHPALSAMEASALYDISNGRVILALDGLQPDVGHEVLWVIRDVLSGEVLLARSLLSSTQDDLARLITEVKEALGVPIVGAVSDGQDSIRKAI